MTARPPRPRPSAKGATASQVRALTAQLAHDVGKYLARTARNLTPGEPLDAGLLDMLVRDLYGDRGAPRPAARFAELAGALLPLLPDERLPAVGGLLGELERLETRVRAGQPVAVARAIEVALQIEQQLRALASQRTPKPPNR